MKIDYQETIYRLRSDLDTANGKNARLDRMNEKAHGYIGQLLDENHFLRKEVEQLKKALQQEIEVTDASNWVFDCEGQPQSEND